MSTSQNPSRPASPELPESVRQAIQIAVERQELHLRLAGYGITAPMRETFLNTITAALTPLWPSADGRGKIIGMTPGWVPTFNDPDNSSGAPEAEPIYEGAATPSPVAGLPTPETPEGDWALDVTVAEGKYTVRQHRAGNLFALRYGEPWQEMNGNNLVLALAQEIESLRSELDKITDTMSGSVNRHMERNAQMLNLRRDLAAARAQASDYCQRWIEDGKTTDSLRSDLAAARAEVEDLRVLFPEVLKALGSGSCVKDASLEYLKYIPNEIRLVVTDLRAQLERANARIAELTKTQAS